MFRSDDSFHENRRSILGLIGAAAAASALPSSAQSRGGDEPGKKQAGAAKEPPPSPAEELMIEHGLLNRVLLVYEESLRRMSVGGDQPAQLDVIADGAGIVRRYIEDHHEKLEEKHIFPRLERSSEHADLVKILRLQHEAGRRLTDRVMQAAKSSNALGDPVLRVQLEGGMRDFIRMYRPHESREDTVLFPAFRKAVSRSEYEALGAEFEKSERQLAGGGVDMMVERVSLLERQLGLYDLAKFTPRT